MLFGTIFLERSLWFEQSVTPTDRSWSTGAGRRGYTRLVAKRSRERLRDRPTMVKKLFVRNDTESLPETALD